MASIEIGNPGGPFDQAKVPVGLQGAKLRAAKKAEVVGFRQDGVFEDLADGGIIRARIVRTSPATHPFLVGFVEMLHGPHVTAKRRESHRIGGAERLVKSVEMSCRNSSVQLRRPGTHLGLDSTADRILGIIQIVSALQVQPVLGCLAEEPR